LTTKNRALKTLHQLKRTDFFARKSFLKI